MHEVDSLETLERIYATPPAPASLVKVADRLTPAYARVVAASPFAALATIGPEGLDCSPRGDLPGFVRVADAKTLLLPDRRGHNRIDSLRNVVRDPRVALLFLVPGSGTTLRVNGRARLGADPVLLESFAVEGQAPRTVMIVAIDEVYFQCARAIVRSRLWDDAARIDPATLPTPGEMLASMTDGAVGGAAYDRAWPERAAKSLW